MRNYGDELCGTDAVWLTVIDRQVTWTLRINSARFHVDDMMNNLAGAVTFYARENQNTHVVFRLNTM